MEEYMRLKKDLMEVSISAEKEKHVLKEESEIIEVR
jgi:hypothetical protein